MPSRPDDPRRSSAYVLARKRWLRQQYDGSPCALCGLPVDVSLPGTHPLGPTVEHTLPVRSHPHLALDVNLWALAHKRCQDRQGARVSNRTRHGYPAPGSEPVRQRDW